MRETEAVEASFSVLNEVPIGMLVLRDDYVVRFWNRCLEGWTGIPRSRIVGTTIGTHFPHLNDAKYTGRLGSIFKGGPPVIFSAQLHQSLIPASLPDGQPRIQHTTVTAVPAPDGASFCALFSIQDVTDLTHLVHDYRAMRDQALEEVAVRKQAEETLATREKLYRTLTETIPHVIWLGEHNGEITYQNKAYEALTGRPLEETLGFGWTEDVHPDDKEELLKKYEEAYTHGGAYHGECRFRAKDGSYRTVAYIGTPVKDEAGQIVQWAGINTDITERKQAEEALKALNETLEQRVAKRTEELEASRVAALNMMEEAEKARSRAEQAETKYQQLYDTAPDMFVSVDPNTTQIIRCNQTLADNLGYTKEEVLGHSLFEMYHPDCMAEVGQAFAAFVNTGEVHNAELQLRRKDGSKIDVILNVSAVRDEQGEILYSSSIWRDITERKQAEENLRASEAKLRAILDNAPAVIYLLDEQDRFAFVNRRWEMLFDKTNEDVAGKSMFEIFPKEIAEPFSQANQKVFETGVPVEVEEVAPQDDGLHTYISHKFPLPNLSDTPSILCGISTDITARKRAEEEVHRLNEELEQRVIERTAQLEAANKELEAFSYSVSHDLRAPLRAIDGFSRILAQRHLGDLDPKAQHYLQRVRRNTRHMGNLIDDLLQFSRLSRQSLRVKPVKPERLVRQVLEELSDIQEERQIEIDIGSLPDCQADPVLLKQVYVNLLSNAVKFTQRCAVAQIRIGAQNDAARPTYFVADNGVGFDMQYAHKLFGVFQRLHRAEDYEGTGVGLALVQRIIHRHGGEIWAEAAPEEGATFFFTLAESSSHGE